LLAVVATAFARALELKGAVAVAASAVVLAGGYLCMFTGYARPASELCLITPVVGWLSERAGRRGRGFAAPAIPVAPRRLLPRTALALLPAALLAGVLGATRQGSSVRWRSADVLLGLAAPLAALVVIGPHTLSIVRDVDLGRHLLPPDARAHGGIWSAAF